MCEGEAWPANFCNASCQKHCLYCRYVLGSKGCEEARKLQLSVAGDHSVDHNDFVLLQEKLKKENR